MTWDHFFRLARGLLRPSKLAREAHKLDGLRLHPASKRGFSLILKFALVKALGHLSRHKEGSKGLQGRLRKHTSWVVSSYTLTSKRRLFYFKVFESNACQGPRLVIFKMRGVWAVEIILCIQGLFIFWIMTPTLYESHFV